MPLGEKKKEKRGLLEFLVSCWIFYPLLPMRLLLGEGSASLFDFHVDSTFLSQDFDFQCNRPRFSGTILEHAFRY